VSVSRSLAPTRLNGNNVNIDMELLAGSETALQQQLVVQGLNAKYQMLRTAITGR
jgi:flagellar basal-body rod protein FlgB